MSAELDGTGTKELGVTAEVGHGGLEGDTCAGRDLLEDHAERLVAKQMGVEAVMLDGLLHGKAKILDGEYLLLGEVVAVDEVFGHCHVASFLVLTQTPDLPRRTSAALARRSSRVAPLPIA
mgnify:CR=1 FL=1